jgi:hypothetical protein
MTAKGIPMAIETERFQVAVSGDEEDWVAVLVDTATGRSWVAQRGEAPAWQPLPFAADAMAAPAPPVRRKARRVARARAR